MPSLLVVYNPVCGDRSATTIFEQHVIPVLYEHGHQPERIVQTHHAGHAAQLVLDAAQPSVDSLVVVLGSGDGTLHEIVDTLVKAEPPPSVQISFVLVPCGTANALYSSFFVRTEQDLSDLLQYRLKALRAFVSSSSTTVPLTLASTSIYPPPSSASSVPLRTSVSAVVASTALHASILHDSEALRATYPGIERFKLAAQQNVTHWYRAHAMLLPQAATNSVQQYDLAKETFVEIGKAVELKGPFSYFLSTVNVDRLEPAFRIAPMARAVKPEGPALDVVVVRPLRDPSIPQDTDEAKERFALKIGGVLGGAYQDGLHVKMTYRENGEVHVGSAEDEISVVEYFRCGGWEWLPIPLDDQAHLVCADGEILQIEPEGKAVCSVLAQTDHGLQLSVVV